MSNYYFIFSVEVVIQTTVVADQVLLQLYIYLHTESNLESVVEQAHGDFSFKFDCGVCIFSAFISYF